MLVDGSSTPVGFRYTVPENKIGIISRVMTHIVDAGMTWTEFAGITALINGLAVKAFDVDDSLLIDFLDGRTIQDNTDWVHLAGLDGILRTSVGPDLFAVRWTLAKTGYAPYLLEGQYFEVLVQDDLSTGIDRFEMIIQGREVQES